MFLDKVIGQERKNKNKCPKHVVVLFDNMSFVFAL
jgi:hypothetical protein